MGHFRLSPITSPCFCSHFLLSDLVWNILNQKPSGFPRWYSQSGLLTTDAVSTAVKELSTAIKRSLEQEQLQQKDKVFRHLKSDEMHRFMEPRDIHSALRDVQSDGSFGLRGYSRFNGTPDIYSEII
jgi:hypothetical protein